MAKDNLTMSYDLQIEAREIDFVTSFASNWQHLQDILGIMQPIRKQPGTVLKSKYAVVTLQSGDVGEGEEIPYSKTEVKEKAYEEMDVKKYSKAVSIEAIKDHGYDNAVAMTDAEFLYELQTEVVDKFYAYLQTGKLTSEEATFQMALSMAKGRVTNKFKAMHKTATEIVAFVNTLDFYRYLGAAGVSTQMAFGMEYIKNFLGYSTIILSSEIPEGKVIATARENIKLYYISPDDSDFARAGLVYRTDGETNLIGFHTQGNYNTAVSEAFAIYGMTLFAEYLDAIAVITVTAGE